MIVGKAFQGRPAEGDLSWNDVVGLPHPLTMDGGGPTYQDAHPPMDESKVCWVGGLGETHK